MNYFRCTVGGGKGNTVTVTCAEEFAGLTITLAKTGKTYTKTCPSTAPYEVTFYGVEVGTYTVSCTVGGQTYSETVVVQDISCVLNYGFKWQTWVDTASQLDSSDYDSLDEVLADEKALRELFLEHACVDYVASLGASNADLETVINNDLCAKWINLSDYALDYLYANEVIADLMDEADKYFYGEWVITDSTTTPPTWGAKGNVPVMTSNTAPYGEASVYRTGTSGGAAWNVFDGNDSIAYSNRTGRNTNDYVRYKFTNPVCVKKVKFLHAQNTTETQYVKVRASNDGTNFVELGSFTLPYNEYASNLSMNYLDVSNNDNYYLYYEVKNNDSPTGSPWWTIYSLQFYGRELKVSVPTMTSNTAPYGEVTSTAEEGTNYAWKAFDGSDTTYFSTTLFSNGHVTYKFNSPIKVLRALVKGHYNGSVYTIKNYKIQGSNDGFVNDTHDLGTYLYPTQASQFVEITSPGTYKYYRCLMLDSYGTNIYLRVDTLQFYGLDYSEKEFESGTTKKWLYDHGVELEELTILNTNANATGIKRDSDIFLKRVSTNSTSMVYKQLDLTNYNLMRMTLSNEHATTASNSTLGYLQCITSLPTTYVQNIIASTGVKNSDADAPYNYSVDISNVNQTCYADVSATAQGNITMQISINEWWLE